MILAVIAIVPVVAERIYNEGFDRKERVEAAYKQALSLARQATATQNEAIVSVRALLQTVASARTSLLPSDQDCNAFLAKIAKPIPWVKTLSVANLQGTIICSSFPGALGLDISERPHFINAVDTGDFFVSDYFVATRVNGPVITAALAQTGVNGGAAAVVLCVVDLRWFEQIARAFVEHSGRMLMIDGAGVVLARYPNYEGLVGRNFSDHPLVKEMLARAEGVTTAEDLDGQRRIFGFVHLPGTRARFAVGYDESEVLGRANHAMSIAFIELGLVAGLVLLGIWFGGERLLVRPILALAQTATRIGRGDTKAHIADLPLATEFVPLAAAMDDMAGQLATREQELRDSNKQLLELAHVDALTGLANRRAFNARLTQEWQLAAKLGQPLAVIMIDVDHFKMFNDYYGHVQGDTCLRKVGDVLSAGTRSAETPVTCKFDPKMPPSFQRVGGPSRESDFAARYGGEEFAVLLQGTDVEGAAKVAERLRQGVEDLLIANRGAPRGFVSISIGVAAMTPQDQQSPLVLTELADAALYQAKQRGRNRITVHTATEFLQAS